MNRIGAGVALGLFCMGFSACGGSAASRPLRAARQSMRFSMSSTRDHGGGEVTRVAGVGSADRGGDWLLTFTQPTGGAGETVTSAALQIGGHSYERFGPSGKWVELPGLARAMQAVLPNFGDPSGLLASLKQMGTVRDIGNGIIDHVPTAHHFVKLDARKLLRRVPTQYRELFDQSSGAPGKVDLWVDQEGRARQVVYRSSNSEGGSLVMTYRYFDFGAPVHVPRLRTDEVSHVPASVGPGTPVPEGP